MKALVSLILCAITVAMVVGYGVATRPVLADNQLYFFQTERCASGVPPHVSHMEVKTQLPSMLGGATIAAGRLVGIDDVYSGRFSCVVAAALAAIFGWLLVLQLAAQAMRWRGSNNGDSSSGESDSVSRATASAAGGLAPHLADRPSFAAIAASLAGAAAVFSIFGLFSEAATGFQPKVYVVMFLLAAHLACAERRYFLCGIAGMCSFLCWQPSGLVLASCGLALLLDRRTTWKSLFTTIGGALLAFALYELYFAVTGGLDAQLLQEWVLAFGAPHKGKGAEEAIWFVLTEAQAYSNWPHGLPATFVAVAALMWLGALVRPRRTWRAIREEPGLVAFWVAAHIAVAFTLYDHQAHPDMLLVQPYFAVACGIGAGWVFSVLARAGRAAVPAIALVGTVFVSLGLHDAWHDVTHSWGGRTGLEEQRAQGHLVSMYFDHRGSVWVLGSVQLLALNHRDNWTPVGNVGHETQQFDMKAYRPLRDGVMPEIIISGRGLRPGGNGWLNAEYVDITPVPLASSRIRVFSRKSDDQPGFAKTSAPKGNPGPKPTVKPQKPQKPAA